MGVVKYDFLIGRGFDVKRTDLIIHDWIIVTDMSV
jgi:hypothetical protein